MFLALVLGLVSCQNNPADFDVNIGNAQEVLINVTLPEGTRADSAEGAITNKIIESDEYTLRYIFQVYSEDKTQKKEPIVQYSDATSVSFPVRLVPGRDYRFVVWADIVKENNKTDLHYNTTAFPTITLMDNTWVAMDETRDAYTVSQVIEDFGGSENYILTLKRPLAKLRVITTDTDEWLGITPEKATVTYQTPHYNTFDVLESEASGEVSNVTHNDFTIEDYETTNGKVLFTDYFFAENDIVRFNLTVAMSDNLAVNRPFTTDIPVKRNHLTTIAGQILTEGGNITVNIVEGFEGEDEYPYEDGIMPANNEIWYTSTDGAIVTPADAFGVKIISNTYNNGLGRIVFDGELTEIGEYAFGWCKLETVTIPYSIERIDSHAFTNNNNLRSINIPHGVKYIGYGAFYNSKIETIKIPDSIIEFDANAFAGCMHLRNFEGKFASDNGRCLIDNGKIIAYAGGSGSSYTIPNEVTTIGFAAFGGLYLENITISNNVKIIGESAFENCMDLTSVTISDGVIEIERDAFYNCCSLTDIDLGESVEYIDAQAFCYCRELQSITIPKSVISIDIIAFGGCDNLTTIYCEGVTPPNNGGFLNNNTSNCSIYVYDECVDTYKAIWSEYKDFIYGVGPYNGTEITTIYYTSRYYEPINYVNLPIKENTYIDRQGKMVIYGVLKNIPVGAFSYNSSLESIIIPDCVEFISHTAFAWSTLKTVVIPESVKAIHSYAFYDCKRLTSVYCRASTPPYLDKMYPFDFNGSNRKIYVPMESVDAYKSAEGWSNYASDIVGYDF